MDPELLKELADNYQIKFNNIDLLEEAFTHTSYRNEHRELAIKDNERLEFLGDAVLELTVSEYLYKHFPELPEGKLTRLRSAIVQTKSFSRFSKEAHFDRYIRLGKGEEKNGARQRATLLEDLFEAFNGALYLDQGKEAVVKFISQVIFPKIAAGDFSDDVDFKTSLQEYLQKDGEIEINYHVLSESGPSHEKKFKVDVEAGGKVLATGTGKNKKAAEQLAARKALDDLKQENK